MAFFSHGGGAESSSRSRHESPKPDPDCLRIRGSSSNQRPDGIGAGDPFLLHFAKNRPFHVNSLFFRGLSQVQPSVLDQQSIVRKSVVIEDRNGVGRTRELARAVKVSE